jgi:hypothetical protein
MEKSQIELESSLSAISDENSGRSKLGSNLKPEWQFKPGVSGNPGGKATLDQQFLEEWGEGTLEKLASLTKGELVALIKRCSGAAWGVGLMTHDEAYEASCLKLLALGLKAQTSSQAIPALREWADRTRGKPAQTVALNVKTDNLSKLTDDKLLALERELSRLTGCDAMVIAPMPKKLGGGSVDDEPAI